MSQDISSHGTDSSATIFQSQYQEALPFYTRKMEYTNFFRYLHQDFHYVKKLSTSYIFWQIQECLQQEFIQLSQNLKSYTLNLWLGNILPYNYITFKTNTYQYLFKNYNFRPF